jgi:lambda repressor-like predicted transcriptional regulator
VDHLANAIETQWQKIQSLVLTSLKYRIQEIWCFGFMDVVENAKLF